MSALFQSAVERAAPAWFAAMGRACWEGGLGILAVWFLCRVARRISPAVRCWLWRLAYARLLVALLWFAPIPLPLLAPAGGAPAAAHPAAATATTPPAPDAGLLILCLWMVGAGVCAAALAAQWVRTARLRREGEPLADGWLHARLWDLCAAPNRSVQRPPGLVRVAGLAGPALVGIAEPAILLPDAVLRGCEPAELRLVLAHEIAHLKRGDLLWNWLPALAHLLFYFHPLVWLANREYRLAEEMACDAEAARGGPATDYCRLLIRLARPAVPAAPVGAAMSVTAQALRQRLAGLLEGATPSPAYWTPMAALIAIGAVAGLLPWRLVERAPAPQSVQQGGAAAPPVPISRVSRVPPQEAGPVLPPLPLLEPTAEAALPPPTRVAVNAPAAPQRDAAVAPPFQPPPPTGSSAPAVLYVRPPAPWPAPAGLAPPVRGAVPVDTQPPVSAPAAMPESPGTAQETSAAPSGAAEAGAAASAEAEGYASPGGEGERDRSAAPPPFAPYPGRRPAPPRRFGAPAGFPAYAWGGGGFSMGAGGFGGGFAFGFSFWGWAPPPPGGFGAGQR